MNLKKSTFIYNSDRRSINLWTGENATWWRRHVDHGMN